MPAEKKLPEDSPLMMAWKAYKSTDDYANSRRWAKDEAHVDGSLWAAFLRGWQMSHGEVDDLAAADNMRPTP